MCVFVNAHIRNRCFLSVAIYNLGDRKTDDIAGKRVVAASLGASRNRFDATYAASIGVRYVVDRFKICEGQFCCVLVCVCVF